MKKNENMDSFIYIRIGKRIHMFNYQKNFQVERIFSDMIHTLSLSKKKKMVDVFYIVVSSTF